MNEDLKKQLEDVKADLQHKIDHLGRIIERHRHTGDDGSDRLQFTIDLAANQTFSIGGVSRLAGNTIGSGNHRVTEAILRSGNDTTISDGLLNTEVHLQHNYDTDFEAPKLHQSFFFGQRGPIYQGKTNLIAGQTTFVQNDFNFTPSDLVGCFVTMQTTGDVGVHTEIFDNTTTFMALIIVNTVNQVTVTPSSPWPFSGEVNYTIFRPVNLGAADAPWNVLSICDVGISFVSKFTANKVGSLYMDEGGNLFWFNPFTLVETQLTP